MKQLTGYVVILVFLFVLVTGCTAQNDSTPVAPAIAQTPAAVETEVRTAEPTEITPDQTPAPVTDSSLSGTWYLKLMSEQNGTAQVQMINPETTVIFENGTDISGYAGCNNYMGHYTLTGTSDTNGDGIAIGPLTSTLMYCAEGSETETTYLQILQGATSYQVNAGQELSITDNLNNALVYQRTPYSATAVPIGS
jgi:heat shock protein HslJ